MCIEAQRHRGTNTPPPPPTYTQIKVVVLLLLLAKQPSLLHEHGRGIWQVPTLLISAVCVPTSYTLLQPPQLSQGSRSLPEREHSHGCILSHHGIWALPGDGSALSPVSGCQSGLSLCSA